VGLLSAEFDRQVREAAKREVKQDLLDYLDYRGPYSDVALRRRYGLINGKLFICSKAMCDFHEAASKEWAKQRISDLAHLPGFDAWFAAWTTPTLRGRLNKHQRAPRGDGQGSENGAAHTASDRGSPTGQEPRGRGRPSASDPTIVDRNARMKAAWQSGRFRT